MELNSSSPAATYIKVADAIRDAIRTGELAPGQQLPAGPKLAQEFGVALMTVRRAIDSLRAEGLLHSTHGVGVFVAAGNEPENDVASLRATVDDLSRRLGAIEERLRTSDGTAN
ncbi:winged helix-turn-helix domain-containing protein [Kribbella sp. NBC_00382]|uniref:GntR family transcriptional regulator n=1 Tax=Kribbella sp. NBC_00382 TaxID=2975967 RepID=UPI002E1B2AB7